MTVRADLFNLDGTLVDSLEDLTEAVNSMLTCSCDGLAGILKRLDP